MARNNRHNAAFVVGAVLGGLAGSAVALWKTPYTGEELRTKITGGGPEQNVNVREMRTTTVYEPSLKDKVLSTVEHTLAPVVGVKLGKTANEGGEVGPDSGYVPAGQRETPTTSMGPGAGLRQPVDVFGGASATEPPASQASDEALHQGDMETGGNANVTPFDPAVEAPSRMSSPTEPAPDDSAASIEDLTKPQIELVPDALKHEQGKMDPFPKLGGTERSH